MDRDIGGVILVDGRRQFDLDQFQPLLVALVFAHIRAGPQVAEFLGLEDILRIGFKPALGLAASLNEAKDRWKMEALAANCSLETSLFPLVDRVSRIADCRSKFGW